MTEHESKVLVKYSIDTIFDCIEDNNVMLPELEKYCVDMYDLPLKMLSDFKNVMSNIVKSYSNNINQNDISFKNTIRECLNKINESNYDNVLVKLKSLEFTSDGLLSVLATELIIKSMNDVLAIKNIEVKTGHKTPSEIYISVITEFSKNINKFKNVFSKECNICFTKFTDINESMDNNNPHHVSNFKGFMNMMGLCYVNKLFDETVIKICLDKIVGYITGSDIKDRLLQEESDNYYSGYERIVNRIVTYYEKNFDNSYKNIYETIKNCNDLITKDCSTNKPLRKFSLLVHSQIVKRCDDLAKML